MEVAIKVRDIIEKINREKSSELTALTDHPAIKLYNQLLSREQNMKSLFAVLIILTIFFGLYIFVGTDLSLNHLPTIGLFLIFLFVSGQIVQSLLSYLRFRTGESEIEPPPSES